MKRFTGMIVAALAVVALATTAKADLVITEVMSSSQHQGPANGDWFELTNTGASVNLENYYWDDDGPSGADGALFPNITIGTNETVVIVNESNANLPTWIAAWGGGITAYSADDFGGEDNFSGLSSSGDQIEIWDSNPNTNPMANLVASVTFGAADGMGGSFEWFTDGTPDGFSVAGEFGAYQALDDGAGNAGIDVGSPGIVVPEPAAASLFVFGGIALLRRRR